jgi:hypothetical protein
LGEGVEYKDGIYLLRFTPKGETGKYYFSPRQLRKVNNNSLYVRATSKDWPTGNKWELIEPSEVMGLVVGIYRSFSAPINCKNKD